jgi:hypothetical protein
MRCELICCENCLARTKAWRHILAPAPQQPRVLGPLKDAVAVSGTDADLVSGLFQARAALADRRFPQVVWRRQQAVRRRQRARQPGDEDVDMHRPGRVRGRRRQAP